jgi:DNA end-binding protein Ku
VPQTVWKGTISFGLVSIPVRLVSATEEKDVSFRQVRRSDGSRVRYRRVAEADGEEVPYAEIAKGYELPDGDMVVLTDDDLAGLPVASGKAVDVLQFVDAAQVDPAAYARPYYAVPAGDAKPYVLLREALERSGRVAVVKVSLRSRERLAVLRPRGDALVVHTMLWPDEVRSVELPAEARDVEPREQEMAMASSYIDAMTGAFTPEEYQDDYRAALEELVASKVEGREVVSPPAGEEEEAEVVDLMEALRRSVAEAQKRRSTQADASSGEAPPAKKPAAPSKRRAKAG